MQKEQDTQFRFTPQVVIILMIVFVAMTIPIICVVLAAQGFFQRPAPPMDPAAFAPLQKALEDVADKSFETKTSLTLDGALKLSVADPTEAEKKVEARVKALGGVSMRSDSGKEEGTVHLLVQLPQNRVSAFNTAPLEAKEGELVAGGQGDDQARALIEVLIQKKAE